MKLLIRRYAENFVVVTSGAVVLMLTLTLCIATFFKLPMDTVLVSLASNIIMAYVVLAQKLLDHKPEEPSKKSTPPEENTNSNQPDLSHDLQTK